MNITMEITERDKKLLLFMAFFVIVLGFGFFVIRPLSQADAELKIELENQQELMMETQQKLVMLPAMESSLVKTQEELEEAAKDFYPVMKSQEIDRLLTGIVVGKGLESRQMTITMPQSELKLEPYYASAAAAEDSMAQSAAHGASEEDGSTAQAMETVFTGIYAAQVQMTIRGNRVTMQQMVDELTRNYPSIRITSAGWGTENNSIRNADGEYITSVNDTLQLGLEVYMYRKDEA